MHGFVIQDTKSGKYVAYPGSNSSFTPRLENARVFPTREIAERERCPQSERIVNLDGIFGR